MSLAMNEADSRFARVVKIAVLDSEVQAEALDSLLTDRGIPHLLKSYCDSALDGIFQGGHGWGHVEAPEDQRENVLQALKDISEPYVDPDAK
jgi:hypothetical protein